MEKLKINEAIIDTMMSLGNKLTVEGAIRELECTLNHDIEFVVGEELDIVTKEEFVEAVKDYLDDGLSSLYESLTEGIPEELLMGGNIYLSDGMYLTPDGDIVDE